MEAVSSLVSVFLVKVMPSFVASVWLDLFLTLSPAMPTRALVSKRTIICQLVNIKQSIVTTHYYNNDCDNTMLQCYRN